MDLSDRRVQYEQGALLEEEAPADPLELFRAWYKAAESSDIIEPNAFCLSTVGPSSAPSSRIVLLKGFAGGKFRFFTGYKSRKGLEIEGCSKVALLWYWDVLERQVRIEGEAAKVSKKETESYFYSRPRGSQLSAYTSAQSTEIASRGALDTKRDKIEKELEGKKVPLPEDWGGFDVTPSQIEFWQGRPSRFHDRILYKLEDSNWVKKRLEP